MKKAIFTFAFVLMIFIIDCSCVFAVDCPTPLNQRKSVLVTINGCEYNLDFCYICDPTAHTNTIRLMGFYKTVTSCSTDWTAQQIVDYIYLNFENNPIWISYNLCGGTVPPCNSGYLDLEIVQDICWYKKNVGYVIQYVVCLDNGEPNVYCSTTYRWCYDSQLGKNVYTVVLGPGLSGNPNCVCPGIEPNYSPPLNGSSDCFQISTLCSYPICP